MRTFTKFIAAAAVLAGFVACNKQEYISCNYVVLGNYTYTVEEDCGKLKIPVYNNNQVETAVSFKAVDKTAKAGEFYTLENKTGVINFEAGKKTDTIVVNIIKIDGYTGNADFDIQLQSATNGVILGGTDACTVTIKDLDHPLSDFFGKYLMKSVAYNTNGSYGYFSWDMEIVADPKNVNNVVFDYMCPFAFSYGVGKGLVGTVSADKTKIEIVLPQVLSDSADDLFGAGMGNWGYYGWDGKNINGAPITGKYTVTFTKQVDGSWVTTDPYNLNSTEYVKTGDWIYYLCQCFASFNNVNFTCFAKQ